MIYRELLKSEIDKVKDEHLELLYGIIRLLESGSYEDATAPSGPRTLEGVSASDWHGFIASTYGCCSDAPLARGEQGHRRET